MSYISAAKVYTAIVNSGEPFRADDEVLAAEAVVDMVKYLLVGPHGDVVPVGLLEGDAGRSVYGDVRVILELIHGYFLHRTIADDGSG